MKKINFNTWSPSIFITAMPKDQFMIGLLATDCFNDMDLDVWLHFIGLQLCFGAFAVNIGFEKFTREK